MDKKKNKAWLLMGLTGSTEGILSLKDGTISFKAFGKGALTKSQLNSLATKSGNENLIDSFNTNQTTEIFKCPISQIDKIAFPWFTFGGGMNLVIKGVKYRFSFLRPQNTVASAGGAESISNISKGRKLGKEWKKILLI